MRATGSLFNGKAYFIKLVNACNSGSIILRSGGFNVKCPNKLLRL